MLRCPYKNLSLQSKNPIDEADFKWSFALPVSVKVLNRYDFIIHDISIFKSWVQLNNYEHVPPY